MFPLLLAKVHTKPTEGIARVSAESPKREAKLKIDGIACFPITNGSTYKLIANWDYCFEVYGSVFFDAEPLNIKGYVNGYQTFEGKGVFATVGSYPESVINYAVKVKSDIDQYVYVISALSLPIDYPWYITTKNDVEEFNLLGTSKKVGDYDRAGFLQLGPKTSSVVTVEMDSTTTSFHCILQLGDNSYTQGLEKKEIYNYPSPKGIIIDASALSSEILTSVNVKINSTGNDWVTPISGYVTIQENHVYEESDIKEPDPGLSDGVIAAIVIVIIVVIAAVFAIWCCIKKMKAKGDNEEKDITNSSPNP